MELANIESIALAKEFFSVLLVIIVALAISELIADKLFTEKRNDRIDENIKDNVDLEERFRARAAGLRGATKL